MKIEFTMLGKKCHTFTRDGESGIDAIKRSILGRGYGRCNARLNSWTTDGFGHYQVTVCGRQSKRGGWPVVTEFWVSAPMVPQ